MPGQAATLEAIRAAAATATTPDDVLTIVERTYQLPAGSATALRLDGAVSGAADLLDPLAAAAVVDHAAQVLRRVGATAEVTLSLCQATLSEIRGAGRPRDCSPASTVRKPPRTASARP